MKKRTLLFGAGEGTRQFMSNHATTKNFVGILDNDVSKQGTLFEGLLIYAPADAHKIAYDEIVITTQWAVEVQNQLIESLDIDPSLIVLPAKHQLKKIRPFEQQQTLFLAREIVEKISDAARESALPVVVDFGTLLGLVRDDDLIAWDDDIDFAAPQACHQQVENLVTDFIASHASQIDWRVERVVDKQGGIAGLLLNFSDANGKLVEFTTSISYRFNSEGKSLHLPSLGMWFAPEKHFQGTDYIMWRGHQIPVPLHHRDYLTFQYGDWETPKKDIQFSDYANLNSVSFEEIEKAGLTAKTIDSCELDNNS